jgi:hypothetical protein
MQRVLQETRHVLEGVQNAQKGSQFLQSGGVHSAKARDALEGRALSRPKFLGTTRRSSLHEEAFPGDTATQRRGYSS